MKSNVSFLRRLGSIIYDFFLVFSFVFFYWRCGHYYQ